MASEQRRRRVEHLMQRALAQLISEELGDDARLGMVTVTAVQVSRDFAYARVFVSLFNAPDEASGLAVLQRRAGHFRHRLGHVLKLRSLPELRFCLDKTVEEGQRLSRLIDEAVGQGAQRAEKTEKD